MRTTSLGGRKTKKKEGSAHERALSYKRMNPWEVGQEFQVCHWVDPRGSTHDSQNFRKNMNKFQKNLKF